MLWLDHLCFGNGFGLRSPYFDNRFYWLSENNKRGRLYTYMAGFGAQLHSTQWFHPRAGERRRLAGRDFVVMSSNRRWLRVQVAWSWERLPRDINEANAALRELEKGLGHDV